MDGAWLAAALLRRVRDPGHTAVPGPSTLTPVSAALREYEKEMFIRSAFYVKNSHRVRAVLCSSACWGSRVTDVASLVGRNTPGVHVDAR